MGLNWINPEEYSFNSFLLLEKFQICLMMNSGCWRSNKNEWRQNMGIALNANPTVRWYLENRCPECALIIAELTRVCKSGGWLLDCPGDSEFHMKSRAEMLANGWEEIYYAGSFDKDVYCYLKQVGK